MSVPKTRADVSQDAPRPLTFAENIVLTLKLLGGAGLLGAAIWALNLLIVPE
jgi:hypothetical protein